MVPVLIGAAVGLADVALFSGTKVRNANAKFCVQCGKSLVDN